MPLVSITVSPEQKDLRADKIIALAFPAVSRTKLQKLFENEQVMLEGDPIPKSHTATPGEVFEFPHPDTLSRPLDARKVPFNVLYEDKTILAINKAPGIAVHPVSQDDEQTTIAHGILAYLGEKSRKIGTPDRPCIVHRLDKETTGVLLIAKTEKSFQALKEIFAKRQIQKEYLAIVRGCPDLLAGSVNEPIGRSPRNPMRMCISEGGKEARTDWDRLALDEEHGIALLKCHLHTGRTHQARVHLSHLGYPVLGDTSYGYRGTYDGRILLHAHKAIFEHPFLNKKMEIVAPIPKDMKVFKNLFDKGPF
jgi:23S rRNA pseudouridine1911/1915/1917 synthase